MKHYLNNKINLIVLPIIFVITSIIIGIISKDYILGSLILISGILNVWYASLDKSYNFIFGALYYILTSYVAYINGLYGLCVLSLLIYLPSQIWGWLEWSEIDNVNYEVKIRRFTLKNSIIITISCIISSYIFGLFLNNISGQQLPFLDSSSNILNICGIILLHLRFRECWWILLFNNIIDLSIWIINVINGSSNAIMMLIVSIVYFTINIYGLVIWLKLSKRSKRI